MTDEPLPEIETVAALKQQIAALQAAGGGTPEDMARMQAALQKWTMANQLQSQTLQQMSDALKGTKCACVISAMMRARVVLPVPGGPHRMIDCSRSRSTASRSGRPGARISS